MQQNRMTPHHYINQPSDLNTCIQQSKQAKFIALDTEFVRRNTYKPQLCLVQVMFDNGEIYLLDALALDLSPFWQALDETLAVKVFHDSRQDCEIIWYDHGSIPGPIFDTKLAALLLGYGESCGFARLVEGELNVILAKDQTATDWSQRPLTEAQLQYAIDDVLYLAQLYPHVRQKLQNKQQLDWLQDDQDDLLNPALYQADLISLRKKLKAPPFFKAIQKHRLDQLLLWREKTAIEQNKPRQWIAENSTLLKLADKPPRHLDDLHAAGLAPQAIRKHGDAIMTLLNHLPDMPEEPTLPAIDKDTFAKLRDHIQQMAEKWHIQQASVIASKDELSYWLVHNHRPDKLTKGWRHAILSEAKTDELVAQLHQQGQLLL